MQDERIKKALNIIKGRSDFDRVMFVILYGAQNNYLNGKKASKL
ncbi:MAG TPA: hypothetical protein VK444_05380 [Methanobacteriaceae archaeon]|nr:hypothetical protein [Methanobacteriaceae archaeon]